MFFCGKSTAELASFYAFYFSLSIYSKWLTCLLYMHLKAGFIYRNIQKKVYQVLTFVSEDFRKYAPCFLHLNAILHNIGFVMQILKHKKRYWFLVLELKVDDCFVGLEIFISLFGFFIHFLKNLFIVLFFIF